jgi:hypothetical protein
MAALSARPCRSMAASTTGSVRRSVAGASWRSSSVRLAQPGSRGVRGRGLAALEVSLALLTSAAEGRSVRLAPSRGCRSLLTLEPRP